MLETDTLNVWYETKLVGQLWSEATGNIGFRYDPAWVRNGFAISHQLPLTVEEYPAFEGKAHRFFANLLPEAGARAHIVRDLKIANSDFALLKALGEECAGALCILPFDDEPGLTLNYKQLTSAEFHKLLLRKGNITGLSSEKDHPRLSLAGAQDKCPIFFDGSQYFWPQSAAPSTHIIKFEVTGYRHLPAYECFLTQLAGSIDLPVVECRLKHTQHHYYLLVKRYDRVVHAHQHVQRLHQEDLCQALGISYEHKYQQDGGPTFHDCYALVQQISSTPIVDAENLLKWQIFNVLAGNSDGHAKNLAFVYHTQQQISLAPFYDLVCTRAIARVDSRLAMSISSEFNPDRITLQHWREFAKECNIRPVYLVKLIQQIAQALLNHVALNKQWFENSYGAYPALQRVQKVVEKQCYKTLRQLAAI